MNKNSKIFKAIGITLIMLGSLALVALLLTLIAVAVALSYYGTLAVDGFDTMGAMIGLLGLGIIAAIYSFVLVGIGVSYLKFVNLTDVQCVLNKGSILGCSIMLTIWIPLIGAIVFFAYVNIGDNSATHQESQGVGNFGQQELALQQPVTELGLGVAQQSSDQVDDVDTSDSISSQQPPQYNNLGAYDRQDMTLTPTQQRYFDNEMAKYRKPLSIERHLNFLRDVRQRGLLTDQEYNQARDKAIESQIKQSIKAKVS